MVEVVTTQTKTSCLLMHNQLKYMLLIVLSSLIGLVIVFYDSILLFTDSYHTMQSVDAKFDEETMEEKLWKQVYAREEEIWKELLESNILQESSKSLFKSEVRVSPQEILLFEEEKYSHTTKLIKEQIRDSKVVFEGRERPVRTLEIYDEQLSVLARSIVGETCWSQRLHLSLADEISHPGGPSKVVLGIIAGMRLIKKKYSLKDYNNLHWYDVHYSSSPAFVGMLGPNGEPRWLFNSTYFVGPTVNPNDYPTLFPRHKALHNVVAVGASLWHTYHIFQPFTNYLRTMPTGVDSFTFSPWKQVGRKRSQRPKVCIYFKERRRYELELAKLLLLRMGEANIVVFVYGSYLEADFVEQLHDVNGCALGCVVA